MKSIFFMYLFFLQFLFAYATDCYSMCVKLNYEFIDNSSRPLRGALGSFYRTKHSVIFKPILCMGLVECKVVNFSDFPKTEHNRLYNVIWRDVSERKKNYGFEELIILVTQETSFKKAIERQKDFLMHKKIKNPLVLKESEDCGHHELSTIVSIDNRVSTSLFSKLFRGKFLKNSKIIYADYAKNKMFGCGCENYFNRDDKPIFQSGKVIIGMYEIIDEKLFFVELDLTPGGKPIVMRKIELAEGDRCNFFAHDLIGKVIKIGIEENLETGSDKVLYINACKNPILHIYEK